MATTSITPDMEANVTGVERGEEQRFQHARGCEGTLSRPAAPRQLRSGTASEQRAAWISRDNSSHRSHPGIDRQLVRLLEPEAER